MVVHEVVLKGVNKEFHWYEIDMKLDETGMKLG